MDVRSFATSVDLAVTNGARVLPLRSVDDPVPDNAILAAPRSTTRLSLSPSSLVDVPAEALLALPSPNGATLCGIAAQTPCEVLVGCLRNASTIASTAAWLAGSDGAIGLIAAGERRHDKSLRHADEDLLGAEAIAASLAARRSLSPEASSATAFRTNNDDLLNCVSGRELAGWGFTEVVLAAQHDVSNAASILAPGVLTNMGRTYE